MNPGMPSEEMSFKAHIVWLLLNGKTDEALERLAGYYSVGVPVIKVGLPSGHRKGVLACYAVRNRTINIFNSDVLMNPFVILHEFYHHLRTSLRKVHRGTERNADEFAKNYVRSYNLVVAFGSQRDK
jgi:hypothetical protein